MSNFLFLIKKSRNKKYKKKARKKNPKNLTNNEDNKVNLNLLMIYLQKYLIKLRANITLKMISQKKS